MKKILFITALLFVQITFAQFGLIDTSSISFVDISTTGTNLNLSDDGEENITTPFTVYLKEDTGTTNLRIGNNGAILFGATTGNVDASNGDLSTSTLMIAPFWDDFDSEMGGVYYEQKNHYMSGILIASEFIIQWDRVHYNGSSNTDTVSFQVVFHKYSKNIDFVYNDVDMDGTAWDYGASATIGISTPDSVYLYSKDTASLVGINAVSFVRKRTYVPDDNFESYLENNGMGDGVYNNYVYTENIKDVTSLDISNQDIVDFTGLQGFESLTSLNVSENSNATIIDISNNTNLTNLLCRNMALTSLDISNLNDLEYVSAYQNNIDTLILGNNTSLKNLSCTGNNIRGLDLSSCTSLTDLNINTNNIQSIDLSNNTLLENLYIRDNPITSIDLSNNTNLEYLFARGTMLTEINLNNNNLLSKINLRYSDNLQTIYLQNGANSLLAGTYTVGTMTFSKFDASDSPNLTCIYVDNATDANAGINDYQDWDIDSTTHFVETEQECMSYMLTYVPDDNFEAYLEANGMGNGIANDDYVSTSNISNVTTLNISSKNISDVTGIQDFTALTTLYCDNNSIHDLDLSNNTNLTAVYCYYNSIQNLDVSANTQLEVLSCSFNIINDLNINNNHNLLQLSCYSNVLTNIDVSNNQLLEILNIGDNLISGIDLSNNTALQEFYCLYNSQITNIDLDNNPNLSKVRILNNDNLTEIHIQNGANGLLAGVYAGATGNLSRFDASNNPNLTCIYVDNANDANAGINDYQDWNIDATAHYVETEQECEALDISELINNRLNIYPNPASNYINIDMDNITEIYIVDMSGKTVLIENIDNNTIDVSKLNNGIYTIKVITCKNIYSTQIIINN